MGKRSLMSYHGTEGVDHPASPHPGTLRPSSCRHRLRCAHQSWNMKREERKWQPIMMHGLHGAPVPLTRRKSVDSHQKTRIRGEWIYDNWISVSAQCILIFGLSKLDVKREVWAADHVLSNWLGLKVSSPSVCLTAWVGQDKTRVSKLLGKHLKNRTRHFSSDYLTRAAIRLFWKHACTCFVRYFRWSRHILVTSFKLCTTAVLWLWCRICCWFVT